MEPINIYDNEKLRTFVNWINWELRKGRSTRRVSDNAKNLLEWNLLKDILVVLTGRAVSFPVEDIVGQPASCNRYVRLIMKKHKYPMQFNPQGHESTATGSRIKNTIQVRERIRFVNLTNPKCLADSVSSWGQELFSTLDEHKDLVNLVKRIDRINYKQLIFIEEGMGIIPELFLYQNFVLDSAAYRKSEEYKTIWEFALVSTQLQIREEAVCMDRIIQTLSIFDYPGNKHLRGFTISDTTIPGTQIVLTLNYLGFTSTTWMLTLNELVNSNDLILLLRQNHQFYSFLERSKLIDPRDTLWLAKLNIRSKTFLIVPVTVI